ncbi:MAG: helicase-related protein [Bacteroidota bacterium]
MNKKLLSEHLKSQKTKAAKKATVFVYKGFPIHFLNELNKELPHVSDLHFIRNETISLDAIEKNAKTLFTKLSKTKEKKSFIIYEELLLISAEDRTKLPVEFNIVINNFYEFYPYQADLSFVDIEESVNGESEIEESILFNTFYAYSRSTGGYNLIQYPEYDYVEGESEIKIIPFFVSTEVSLPEFNSEFADVNNLIQFKASDNSYNKLKCDIFLNQIPKELNLLVDENIYHLVSDFDELKVLYKILSASDCAVHLFVKKNKYNEYYRPELNTLLQKYWGAKAQFKKLDIYHSPDTTKEMVVYTQGSVVEHIIKQSELAMEGKLFEDVFLTAPTGAGKSLLFQLPAIYLAEKENLKAVTIIVSPLKALMADQVNALKDDRHYNNVEFLNSDLTINERQKILEKTIAGEISVLYLAPELLLTYDIKTFIGERELGLLIIDEAHLVTTWGRDFRVDYWFLGNYIRNLRRINASGNDSSFAKNYRFPVVALTATAVYNGKNDMVFDTISTLNMQNCRVYIGQIKREEILFDYNKLVVGRHDDDKNNKTIARITEFVNSGKKSIIYFPWKTQIEKISMLITGPEKALIKKYHADLFIAERRDTLATFKSGACRAVMATKAFGMGVDISDIEIVYHHAPSGTLADYVQEIGRAARIPGMKGVATMDFNPKDLKFTKALFVMSSIKPFQIEMVLRKILKLYQVKKNRNIYLYVDNFKYIFSEDKNPEQKVKSSLLLIEKDLHTKYGFNLVVARPKNGLTVVYGTLENENYDNLKAKYGVDIEEIFKNENKKGAVKLANGAVVFREDSTNKKFVKINLRLIWEKHFQDISFQDLRYKYFHGKLFPAVEPMQRLHIHFNDTLPNVLVKFTNGIQFIENTFLLMKEKTFTKDKLIEQFGLRLSNESTCRKLAELLIGYFGSYVEMGKPLFTLSEHGHFLGARRAGSVVQYRFSHDAFKKVRTQLMRNFQISFDGIDDDKREYTGFINVISRKSNDKLKIAYMLEVLELATYEVGGGEQAQILLRLNDPKKFEALCKQKYVNAQITEIERKHNLAMDIMTYFFQNKMSDKERWNYIEDFFLGKDVKTQEQVVDEEEEVIAPGSN